ncbi:MAG: hypothetical protein PQJ44_09510 [Sphaerochaetaceae bacterium]|nr:hypothetical protein [Sphaerochaetaceae bacterium]
MEKTNKTNNKSGIQTTKQEETKDVFVKASDFTEKMFKDLPRIKCTLKKTVSKKGYTRCSLDIVIHKTYIVPSIQLSEIRFNYLRLKLGLDTYDHNGREIFDYTFMAPYRFVQGNNTNGVYKSIEIILGKELSEMYFFNNRNEVGTLDILEENGELKINWLHRPDKIDVAETINNTWDE